MNMDSPDMVAEGIKEEDGSSSLENVDQRSTDNRNKQREHVFPHKREVMNDGTEVHLDHYSSSAVMHVGAENEVLQSCILKSKSADLSSLEKNNERSGLGFESDLKYDDVERRIPDFGTEGQRLHKGDYQSYDKKVGADCDEPIAHPGYILDNNANEIFNNEFQSEDSCSLPHNSLLTGNNGNPYEIMGDEAFTHQIAKSPTLEESGNGDMENASAKFRSEDIEVNLERDSGDFTTHTEMKEDYSSVVAASENGGIVWENSNQHSPQRTQNASPSPQRQFSISAERSPNSQVSPHTHQSPRQGLPPAANIDINPAPSPISCKRKQPPSPEKHGVRKRSSRDHASPARHRSPERSTLRDSYRRDGSPRMHIARSPRRRESPRRRDRSTSRSSMRRRDSPGRKRDHHRRSRSRSPHARDGYRRSPRRRPSPRRRSPPPGYSRRRSPRRPWSPPPNRNTGLGKPGNNLFVAGFNYVTTERDLEKKFSRYGRVKDVRIVKERRTGESRGFGFVSLERDEDADAAIRAVDQTEWNGRVVLVEKSKTATR